MKKIIKYTLLIALFGLVSSCDQLINQKDISEEFNDVNALVEDAKSRIVEIEVAEFRKIMDQEEYFILIDVRTEKEHDSGYIPGSVLIPRGLLEFRISNEAFWEDEGMYLPEKTDQLIVYCKSGSRSALAADVLRSLGYENVFALKGGWRAWKEAYPEIIEKNDAPVFVIPSSSANEGDDSSC